MSENLDLVGSSVVEYNHLLTRLAHVRFVSAWKGIGSTIFFSYGMPIIKRVVPQSKPAVSVVRGEGSIGIHADDWALSANSQVLLTSETINNAQLSQIGRALFRDTSLPCFHLVNCQTLELSFEHEIRLRIGRNLYETGDRLEDEVSITIPGARRHFNFVRGFYETADAGA